MRRVPQPPSQDRPASESHTVSPAVRRVADAILWVAAVGFAIWLARSMILPGRRAASVASFLFWYVLPALVVLLAVWALRSTAERRVASALLLLSAIGSVIAAEALLRSFPSRIEGLSITTSVADSVCQGEFRRQAGCLAAAVTGIPFDRRTTLDMIEDFRARGIEAWPNLDASHYIDAEDRIEIEGRVLVPLSPGIPEVLTVFCNEAGDWVTYEADEYGFNNPPGSHRAGEVQVAIIGDSFVHGWCVPFEQTLVGQMRDLDSNVLNVGLEGSGPLAQLGLVVEYVAPLSPAVVVWAFFEGNDLRDFSSELSDDLLTRYLTPGFKQGLRELNAPLEMKLRERVLRLFDEEATKAQAARGQRESARRRRDSIGGWIRLTELRSRLKRLVRSREPAHPYDPAVFEQVASRMRDDVADWGGTLVFAYLPQRRRFEDPTTANPHRETILAQVTDLGIPTVDLFAPLAAHPDPLSLYPFRIEDHFTAEGYHLLARALEEGIRELPSRPQEARIRATEAE